MTAAALASSRRAGWTVAIYNPDLDPDGGSRLPGSPATAGAAAVLGRSPGAGKQHGPGRTPTSEELLWRTRCSPTETASRRCGSPYSAAHTLGPECRTAPRPPWPGSPRATHGVVAWYGWLSSPGDRRAAGGAVRGAGGVGGPRAQRVGTGRAGAVALTDGRRSRLVTTDLEEFLTREYLYRAQETLGAKVEAVPAREDLSVDLDRLLEAIDTQTALVAVTHVAFRSSALLDASRWPPGRTRWGRWSCSTPTQSAGTVPIDVAALDVDLMVGGSVKWLLGGPGTGYLYAAGGGRHPGPVAGRLVGPTRTRLAFRPSPIAYAPGAGRFVTGTPNVAAHVMAAEATSSSPRPGRGHPG